MRLLLRNTERGLIPLYPSDFEEKKRLKIGEEYEVSIRSPRNYKFHKKFFALLNLAFENQDRIKNFELFRAAILIECGYYHEVHIRDAIHVFPKSISFSNMDDTEFEKLYNSVHKYCTELLGLPDNIQYELINFM